MFDTGAVVQEPVTFADVEEGYLKEIRARTDSPLLVDLGCGQTELRDGFIGADCKISRNSVIWTDLFVAPWPWADGTVDAFTSSHFIEHVPDWELHFSEIYRCLKVGGFYRFICPYGKSDRFLQDPGHRQAITERRLWYLQQPWLRANKIEHEHAPVNFSVQSSAFGYNLDFNALAAVAEREGPQSVAAEKLAYARIHHWNVVDDLYVLLKKEPMPED